MSDEARVGHMLDQRLGLRTLHIASVTVFVGSNIHILSFFMWQIIPGSATVNTTARFHIDSLIICAHGIATPLVAIALLKPVRDAIKTMPKNIFCKKDNRIHPTEDSNTTELMKHQRCRCLGRMQLFHIHSRVRNEKNDCHESTTGTCLSLSSALTRT